ncbi:diaminopimelate decarboxylase [Calidithermus roseus]|uniref:Diaminopimelate decarboxylase n=1 Tax=Calidithermus roseus TaxID=1644118 RepID=A0A399ERY3_9DEIN|nr:diaminopimelate decarboxylase [Calidithermus roseus]RIH86300.1 Diaminopimelate decarboxylase [Calidithermus roseus]
MSGLNPRFRQALQAALERYETPFYAYDLTSIQAKVSALRAAFPQAELFFAMKANPRLGILRRLLGLGVFLEAVSLGEVRRAYAAGFKRKEVLLNGPLKTPAMLAELKEIGVPILGLDSLPDAERVTRHLPGSHVILRVNPDLPVLTHDHLATGRGESKFGILPQDIGRALKIARAGDLDVLGLHVHLGSALERAEDFHAGYALMEQLYKEHGPFEVLNLGGGFGLGLDLTRLAPAALGLAERLGVELWLEPGRYLVAEAGVLVTRTWGLKQTRRKFLLVDAGMSHLLRPMLYGAQHPVEPLYKGGAPQTFDLAGPACESGDILAKDLTLPTPKEGDALAIMQAGAYGSSMSSNYLDTPRPLELLWTGEEWEVLRRRQSWESLLLEEQPGEGG